MNSTPADQALETLRRLYDDQDNRITDLLTLNTDETTIDKQQTVFSALCNSDRLYILAALQDGEKCACELQVVLNAPQSTVSTHLGKLRTAGLIQRRQKGKWSYYRLSDGAIVDILNLAAAIAGDQ